MLSKSVFHSITKDKIKIRSSDNSCLCSHVRPSHRAAAIMSLSGEGRLQRRHFVSRPTGRKRPSDVKNVTHYINSLPSLERHSWIWSEVSIDRRPRFPMSKFRPVWNAKEIVSDAAELATKWTSCDNMFRWLTLPLLCVFTGMTLFRWRPEPSRTLNATQIHIFFFK